MHLSIAFNRLRNLNAKIRDEPNENFAGERNCAIEINELQARFSNSFIILHYHCDVIERRKAGVSLDVYCIQICC